MHQSLLIGVQNFLHTVFKQKAWITVMIAFMLNIATPAISMAESESALYLVGPGDTLSVSVYGLDEFTDNNIPVRSDGRITVKGLGEVPVEGKNIDELQLLLEEKLRRLVLKPIVTVSIVDTKPGIIYLTGAVRKPGMYELSTKQNMPTDERVARSSFRVSNILSLAGGLLTTADLSHVEIRDSKAELVKEVDLWRMLKEGDMSQDALLQSGYRVNIPELSYMALNDEDYILLLKSSIGPQAIPIRVLGAVKTPGLLTLDGASPFLSSAIAKAGGFDNNAYLQAVVVKRFVKPNELTALTVDPRKFDIPLRPNDILEIKESNLAHAGDKGRFAANMLSPLSSLMSSAFALTFMTGFR
jgi:polysaccharide export outer membrane protein